MPRDIVVIIGPPAVGKMTVGQELSRLTGFHLFHNHHAIDLALELFDPQSGSFKKVIKAIRDIVFREFSEHGEKGFIFTYVLSRTYDLGVVQLNYWTDFFRQKGGKVYIAELKAPMSVRLDRNKTENRLQHKPSKRNLKLSEDILIKSEMTHQYDNFAGQPLKLEYDKYILIDNTFLSAQETAHLIASKLKYL